MIRAKVDYKLQEKEREMEKLHEEEQACSKTD